MKVAKGSKAFRIGTNQCSATGVRWKGTDPDTALAGHIASVLFDDPGSRGIRAMLASLTKTRFAIQAKAPNEADCQTVIRTLSAKISQRIFIEILAIILPSCRVPILDDDVFVGHMEGRS